LGNLDHVNISPCVQDFKEDTMFSIRIAVAGFTLALLGACALSPSVQYRSGTGPFTASVSDDGLSAWTDIPADEIRLTDSNVFVGGAPLRFSMMGGVLVDNTSVGNARLAKLLPPGFGVKLSPFVEAGMQASAKSTSARPLVLSAEHADSHDMHLAPLVRLSHIGDGLFALAPQVKVSFVDTEGKRQTRTYIYHSPLRLPVTDTPGSWSADGLRIYKRQLSLAYETLARVILLDQQGRFVPAFTAQTPNVIREEKVGIITAKTVLIEDLGDVRVTHGMVGSTRGTQHIVVEDKRSPDELVKL
jgi:hypothetical protein